MDEFQVTSATCQVLAGIFPIVLLTLVLDRRLIALKIRRMDWFRKLVLATLLAALIGLVLAVIGVEGGYTAWWALILWACAAATALGFAVTLLFTLATAENDEDDETPA